MTRRYPLLIFATLVVIVTFGYFSLTLFEPQGFPFFANVIDARTAAITPIPGIPMPAGLQSGDRIDVSALDLAARIDLVASTFSLGNTLPLGKTVQIVIRRGGAAFTVPVSVVDLTRGTDTAWFQWSGLFSTGLLT